MRFIMLYFQKVHNIDHVLFFNDKLRSRRVNVIAYPNARYMLPIASELYRQGAAVAVAESQPVYLRDKVTWKNLPGR